eukprot:4977195-Prymnesium_polylepis.1
MYAGQYSEEEIEKIRQDRAEGLSWPLIAEQLPGRSTRGVSLKGVKLGLAAPDNVAPVTSGR